MEPKKIKIKKGPQVSGSHGKMPIVTKQNKQDALQILENTVKKLSHRFDQYGFNDSKEEEFLSENKGKNIVVELQDRNIEGILQAIDKYRICVNFDDKDHYLYKHAVVGYHVKK